ncbi:uncharacterized protein [Triticum aestivum]|uniref:uncharacterized protein n=1 Tax=Triticum aestivum TaxID=4565 RepID=UPI001D02AEE9|nr:uncharacterized protein LOC123168372 [Triticum aestivum]
MALEIGGDAKRPRPAAAAVDHLSALPEPLGGRREPFPLPPPPPPPALHPLFQQAPLPTAPSGLLVDSFDYVGLEPPPDVLENLKVVKITNFSWNRYELQLVFFLLRKTSSLHKLVLITSSLEPLHVPGIQKADLLFLAQAVANGKVILSGSDDAATPPFHSDVSADF